MELDSPEWMWEMTWESTAFTPTGCDGFHIKSMIYATEK